jgi:hypothetical protein
VAGAVLLAGLEIKHVRVGRQLPQGGVVRRFVSAEVAPATRLSSNTPKSWCRERADAIDGGGGDVGAERGHAVLGDDAGGGLRGDGLGQYEGHQVEIVGVRRGRKRYVGEAEADRSCGRFMTETGKSKSLSRTWLSHTPAAPLWS